MNEQQDRFSSRWHESIFKLDQLVQTEGSGTCSEYMRELMRQDQDKHLFKVQLQMRMTSCIDESMDGAFFTALRARGSSSRKTP